jgi:6-pyruvoyltetrahydropterin/6-carboxytetrahydropterin synthase
MSTYHAVQLEKEDLVFSAAHFITFGDNICERMHGHNYRVRVRVVGPLQEHGYVVDFIALHNAIRNLVLELDHRVLLPTRHPSISVRAQGDEVEARFDARRWILPREDCVLLEVPNTTAEHLAGYLADRLIRDRNSFAGSDLHEITVEVDENHGQWGGCTRSLP